MIYLDNNSTTRIDPRVLETMLPFLTDSFANASSTHKFGVMAGRAVNLARQQVAELLNCNPGEIIFTSGATEAINLAIKGVAESYCQKGKHIVTVQTEHKAVLDVCYYLEGRGFEVTYLPVQPDGLLDINTVEEAIRPDTILVCVMTVNNEIGVIQPIKEIAELAHVNGALFMTDATQAVGKMAIDVEAFDIDLLAFSSHKFYGPKGIGGLYIRQHSTRNLRLQAAIHGGGHEKGLRSGTLNVPGIVGLGKAAELSNIQMHADAELIRILRDHLELSLLSIPNTKVNGNKTTRLYNVTNILFKDCDSDALILGLNDIAVSNGSACTAALIEPSHVLSALGLNKEDAFSCLRFSLGRFNNSDEILDTVSAVNLLVQKLRMLA
ncbi:IscS subfamily cysteine desulfurase [Siphonobacter sp. BAB-5405]|uniref:cysteine desulfurase family protein n=1 Tax=Siphonobacter sp. BAB-5405 TaxID=1864825 RepID=UPI000C805AAD|nr:cysteine desulfurase family protein [Siphonobacter sp. BAB-5405]PMD95681.1 IscS subfamily cysteine desulfurase [Siphonobacter sp. BAB-5405]